jgi:hypothetical protein
MRSKLRSVILMLAVFGMLSLPGWSQCIMCVTALSSSPEGRALAGSFRYGILFLLVIPYLIVGSIGYAIFRACRKQMAPAARKAKSIVSPVYNRAHSLDQM